ncbi:MAG: ABC transporter permease subunit [Firmicutes bacterium]|nr:ABC transporter permease subunit [Bacillota bacterium]
MNNLTLDKVLRKAKKIATSNRAIVVYATIVLILVWQLFASTTNAFVMPSPFSTTDANGFERDGVFITFFRLIQTQTFFAHLRATLWRVFFSFIISFSVAALLAVLSTINKVEYALKPIINVLIALPVVVIAVLMLRFFSRETAPIFVGFLLIFPLCYEGVLSAVKGVDKKVLEMSKVFNVPPPRRIPTIYIFSVMPHIISTAKVATLMNLKAIVSAEVIINPVYGIGQIIFLHNQVIQVTHVFAWALVVIILSFAIAFAFDLVKKFACRWQA